MTRENKRKRLQNNLDYLQSLLYNQNRDTIDTDDKYLKVRILEVELEINKL